jgi:hypothetical protein
MMLPNLPCNVSLCFAVVSKKPTFRSQLRLSASASVKQLLGQRDDERQMRGRGRLCKWWRNASFEGRSPYLA